MTGFEGEGRVSLCSGGAESVRISMRGRDGLCDGVTMVTVSGGVGGWGSSDDEWRIRGTRIEGEGWADGVTGKVREGVMVRAGLCDGVMA